MVNGARDAIVNYLQVGGLTFGGLLEPDQPVGDALVDAMPGEQVTLRFDSAGLYP